MDLYLMRHGDALSKQETGVATDAERTLSTGGIDDVKAVARSLKQWGIKPSRVVTSPLKRAMQTAELMAREFFGQEATQLSRALHPEGEPSAFIDELRRAHVVDEILLAVGHQPLLGRIVGQLVFGQPQDGLGIKPGGVVWLELLDFPRSLDATLVGLWNPEVFGMMAR